jgi:hypothetical protein
MDNEVRGRNRRDHSTREQSYGKNEKNISWQKLSYDDYKKRMKNFASCHSLKKKCSVHFPNTYLNYKDRFVNVGRTGWHNLCIMWQCGNEVLLFK